MRPRAVLDTNVLAEFASPHAAGHLLSLVIRRAVKVKTSGSLPAAIRDPDDRMLLALAKAGRARFLVTGDGDLLDIERISGTLIVTSSEFLEAIKG